MTDSGSNRKPPPLLQRVGLAFKHPDWAYHFLSNRLRSILLTSLMGRGGDPGATLRLADVTDRMQILSAIQTGRPLCLDIGDQALIVYPENLRNYVYEDTYAHELFRQTVPPGGRVADLGAHNGYYSILAARQVGATGRVFAFEPDPTN